MRLTNMNPGNTDYESRVEELKQWLIDSGNSAESNPEARTWCVLDITDPLTADAIYQYFDSTSVNEAYQAEVDKKTFTNTPVAYLQAESDGLSSLAKMYIYRHQPRLKNYRDDCENKTIRNPSSLSISLARLRHLTKLT